MPRPKVFIASSSEGIDIANAIQRELLQAPAADEKSEPCIWARQFALSETNIEALERSAAEADLAVFVMRPDDITNSREQDKPVPRDNVVFELGLFMGCLGRDRCLIVCEAKPDLKLPSDLLGISTARFERPADRNWKAALAQACDLIRERIAAKGPRPRLSRDALAAQEAVRTFCGRVAGPWWERVLNAASGKSALSFFRIEEEAALSSISVEGGESYDTDGNHAASWKSMLARVDTQENRILFLWKGWHTRPDLANFPFHGFAEMEFQKPLVAGGAITRGGGRFWNVDEAHPEQTVVKPIQFRRVLDEAEARTMTGGSAKDKRALVTKTLMGW